MTEPVSAVDGAGSDAGYGQPPAQFVEPGTPVAPIASPPSRPAVRVGWGALLACIGLLAVLIAFTLLPWYDKATAKFPEINTRLSGASRHYNGWAQTYFGWLAWVMAGLTFLTAFAANATSRRVRWFRVAGALLALASIGLTFRALNLFINSVPTYSQYLNHARSGFYATLAAFLVMGIAAVVGRPRR